MEKRRGMWERRGTLADKLKTKSSAIDFLRILAAVGVICNHAHAITGSAEGDLLERYSGGDITFGELAVAFFLFISGLYVTKSLLTKQDVKGYIIGRLKRVYPLFAVVVLGTVFIVGPCISELSVYEYFTTKETYLYLSYLIFIPNYHLPGVFNQNPVTMVNGSLWSLVLEMICYTFLLLAYKLGILRKKLIGIWIFLFCICVTVIFGFEIPFLYQYAGYLRPLFCFFTGMFFYLCRERIVFRKCSFWIGIMAALLLAWIGRCSVAEIIVLPYLVCVGMDKEPAWLKKVSVAGRYSYAMYLIGYPVQQIVYQTGIGPSVLTNVLFSVVIAGGGAVLLYHWIEKKFEH